MDSNWPCNSAVNGQWGRSWLWCQCNEPIYFRHVKHWAGILGKTSFVQRQLQSGKFTLRNWLAKHDQYDKVSYILKKETVLWHTGQKLITLFSLDLHWLQMATTCWFWEKFGFALNLCLKFWNYSKVLCKIPYLVNIHYENGKENVILHNILRFLALSVLFPCSRQGIIM